MRGEVIVITRQVDVGWTVQDVYQPCRLLDQPQPEIRTMSPELYLHTSYGQGSSYEEFWY
jgi:hypothetical protein